MSVANLLTTGNVLDTGGEIQNPTFQTIALTGGAGTIGFNSGNNFLQEAAYTNWQGATGGPFIAAANTTPAATSILAGSVLLPVGGDFQTPAAWINAIAPPGTATGTGVTKALVEFPAGAQFDYANQSGNVALPASSPASVTVACPGVLPTSLIQVTPLADVTAASQIYVVPGTDSFDIKATTGPAANANIAWFVHKY